MAAETPFKRRLCAKYGREGPSLMESAVRAAIILLIETKYFKQDVVWECTDCRRLSVTVHYSVPHKLSTRCNHHGVAAGLTLTVYILSFLAAAVGRLPDM